MGIESQQPLVKSLLRKYVNFRAGTVDVAGITRAAKEAGLTKRDLLEGLELFPEIQNEQQNKSAPINIEIEKVPQLATESGEMTKDCIVFWTTRAENTSAILILAESIPPKQRKKVVKQLTRTLAADGTSDERIRYRLNPKDESPVEDE